MFLMNIDTKILDKILAIQIQQYIKKFTGNSGQDGGIGRDPSLPCTTKRRITTNLKSINNQKCQKIKLHGTLKTKKLKKKSTRTTRPVKQWTMQAGTASQRRGGHANLDPQRSRLLSARRGVALREAEGA